MFFMNKKSISKKTKITLIASGCITLIVAVVLSFVFSGSSFGRVIKKASKNLTEYAISAEISTEFVVSASQTVDYVNTTGQDLENICFHLYPMAFREDATIKPYTNLNKASCFPNGESFSKMTISKVEVNGQSANFELSGEDFDILQVNFVNNLQAKKRAKIQIDYILELPNCTHRLGYYDGVINLGNWYPVVCYFDSQGWDMSPYYSTGDPFVSSCANYTVSVKYPLEFDCYATGNKTSGEAGKTVFNALAVRDFAVVLTNKGQSATKKAGNTTVEYVGYNQDADIEQNAELSKKAVEFFSEVFMTYPYENLVVIKSSFLHGGMEYPNLVIVSDNINDQEEFQKVIVHEIAHQWWYGLVGNNQITEAWLDESLAEYSTCLFFEDQKEYNINYSDQIKDATASYLIYVDVISSLNGKVNTAINCAVYDYTNEYEYTYMVYVKGVIMFDSLREVVGKDKLIKGLKKYAKEYAFCVASGQDLIKCLKSTCHKDLDNFFSGWLNGSNVIGQIS